MPPSRTAFITGVTGQDGSYLRPGVNLSPGPAAC